MRAQRQQGSGQWLQEGEVSTDSTAAPNGDRYCEEKFVQKYIPTIGVDYGVKPVKLGDYEVSET